MNKYTVFYIQQGNTNSKLKGECIMSWFTDESGSVVGEGSIGGYYGDSYGSYEGKIYDDGTIVDKTGSIVGNIGEDGQVYDRYGDPTDYTYGD